MADQTVLAFDTSAAHCAAALLCNGAILGSTFEAMQKGQAEALVPLIQTLLAETQTSLHKIGRIGVGLGPGNFTGIRISISLARGLGLSLDCPVIGVDSFEASIEGKTKETLIAIPATRDQFYTRSSANLQATPQMSDAPTLATSPIPVLYRPKPDLLVANMARIAARRDVKTVMPPAPLYVKPADAALRRDPGPKILHPNAS
ncbi:tRNA (adenosine(37)-N6)-threonylcarbamoyltransferase complex dimerization subunit type 1 TsaB [Rhodobacteraceae bacterium IMCC1335]